MMRAHLRRSILLALAGREASSLEIVEAIIGEQAMVPFGFYSTLRSLEAEGFISSREGPPVPERGNRPRFYYQLTGHGLAELRSEPTDPLWPMWLVFALLNVAAVVLLACLLLARSMRGLP